MAVTRHGRYRGSRCGCNLARQESSTASVAVLALGHCRSLPCRTRRQRRPRRARSPRSGRPCDPGFHPSTRRAQSAITLLHGRLDGPRVTTAGIRSAGVDDLAPQWQTSWPMVVPSRSTALRPTHRCPPVFPHVIITVPPVARDFGAPHPAHSWGPVPAFLRGFHRCCSALRHGCPPDPLPNRPVAISRSPQLSSPRTEVYNIRLKCAPLW